MVVMTLVNYLMVIILTKFYLLKLDINKICKNAVKIQLEIDIY